MSAEKSRSRDNHPAYLTPVDWGDVCVNIEDVWLATQGLVPPQTLADLTKPEYENLFVTPGATTSSPGMSFLLATIREFGPGEWQTYWQELMDNGAKVTSGWTDAYTVDFTAGGGGGDRPNRCLHLPPAVHHPRGRLAADHQCAAGHCFRKVEYAGVLAGAANPRGGERVIDWLLSDQVRWCCPSTSEPPRSSYSPCDEAAGEEPLRNRNTQLNCTAVIRSAPPDVAE